VPKVYFSFYQQSKYIFTCIHIFSLCKSRSTAKKKFYFFLRERRKFYFFSGWGMEKAKGLLFYYFCFTLSSCFLLRLLQHHYALLLFLYCGWKEAQRKFLKVIFVLFSFHPLLKFQWPFFSELWNFCVCKLSDFLLLLE